MELLNAAIKVLALVPLVVVFLLCTMAMREVFRVLHEYQQDHVIDRYMIATASTWGIAVISSALVLMYLYIAALASL